ncbi:hypothetical protein CLHUN_04680 [Ruminiclostridium hungatei]|uniref:Spermatogenesis-associated protein 20-like TRX domain-containing protein n=1 Tax=Ruminiclostridium hungatei TaxID=48256 RepID=A0A1V4SQE3_RUMHU|nr:hypothetical protein CLHUN_04680 [Ruminiclostridium hungatei]
MERESFEDLEVAQLLNKYFVCIKVDREERPDIDSIYMSVCQALTGYGGWPLTVFLTPGRQPFFAGTYYPKDDSRGTMGLLSLLQAIRDAWENNRKALLDSAREIIAYQSAEKGPSGGELTRAAIQDAFSHLKYSFDSSYGGFGRAPKFPSPHNLLFLLRYWYDFKEPYALEIVEKTLVSMKTGGIFDHIGFGFSRYSTDRKWLVPHFEKMLYDNALLALAYGEAFSATGKKEYSAAACQILEYVLRDMTSSEGGFYSAEDADSEGVEGKFYVWTPEEISEVLGPSDAEEYCRLYDITESGNFEDKNIPNLIETGSLTEDKLEFAEKCRIKLFNRRENRLHPYKDDKILTGWNGLMLAAFAYCGRIFKQSRFISAAEKCAGFILEKLLSPEGRLLARYRAGEAAINAFLEDYAFLVWGLLELYEATYKAEYLKYALKLNGQMLELFTDENSKGLFLYGKDSEELITRPREGYDGAMPSGNSAAAMNLIRLARLTGQHELEERAKSIMDYFSDEVESAPTGHSYMLCAYMYSISENASEVVMTGNAGSHMSNAYNSIYSPFSIAVANITPELAELVPFIEEYKGLDNKNAAYVCRNFACSSPVTEPSELISRLSSAR